VLVLFDLTSHLQRGGEQLASQVGITSLQWIVLLQIAGDPNFAEARDAQRMMLASEIARQRALSKPTISAVVSELKRRGLIREQPDASDRRRRRLLITPQGARALASLEPIRRAANRRLLEALSSAERRRLLHYLEQCMTVLWQGAAGKPSVRVAGLQRAAGRGDQQRRDGGRAVRKRHRSASS
jgi:DNA-binding MarR family transcriptional regulator